MGRMLKWTVEMFVDESWVADGFDLTDERAKQMLEDDLRFAYPCEINARVIKRPAAETIRRLQNGEE